MQEFSRLFVLSAEKTGVSFQTLQKSGTKFKERGFSKEFNRLGGIIKTLFDLIFDALHDGPNFDPNGGQIDDVRIWSCLKNSSRIKLLRNKTHF